MPMKIQSILECLNYDDCKMDTLLYLICLDGVDPKSVENWDNQYEDMGELVFKTFEEARGQCDELELAKTLASAILRIGKAMREAEAKESASLKATKGLELHKTVELSVLDAWTLGSEVSMSKAADILADIEKYGLDLEGEPTGHARSVVHNFLDLLLHTVNQNDTFIGDNKITEGVLILGRELEKAIALSNASKTS